MRKAINGKVLEKKYDKEKMSVTTPFRGQITDGEWISIACILAAITIFQVMIVPMFGVGQHDPLTYLTIIPQEKSRLLGIVTWPLIHDSWSHYKDNIVPLVIFLMFLAHVTKRLWTIVIGITAGGGALVWIFHDPAIIAGASGLIFGLIVYVPLKTLFNFEFYQFCKTCLAKEELKSFVCGAINKIAMITIIVIISLAYKDVFFNGIEVPEENTDGVAYFAHLLSAIAGLGIFTIEILIGIVYAKIRRK